MATWHQTHGIVVFGSLTRRARTWDDALRVARQIGATYLTDLLGQWKERIA